MSKRPNTINRSDLAHAQICAIDMYAPLLNISALAETVAIWAQKDGLLRGVAQDIEKQVVALDAIQSRLNDALGVNERKASRRKSTVGKTRSIVHDGE